MKDAFIVRVWLLLLLSTTTSLAKRSRDGAAEHSTGGSTSDPAAAQSSRPARDTSHSLISQMAEPGGFTETLSEARPVSITTAVNSATIATQSAKPSLFDDMPNRGASIFPVTISPPTFNDQYGPPSVPFAVSDATYSGSSSHDELTALVRRYISDLARSRISLADTNAARALLTAPAQSYTTAVASPAPSTLYQPSPAQSPVQAAPAVGTVQPPGISSSYSFPQAAQNPPQSYGLPQSNPIETRTVTVTQAAPVTSYVVQSAAAPPAAAVPVQTYARPQAAPVVTQTVQRPAAAAPAHTYVSSPSQTPVIFQQQQQQQQQQQRQPVSAVSVLQQPSFVVPAPVGSYFLQSAAAAPGVSQSYSVPVQNPLLTPQLTYVAPYGASGRRQRDRERDDDSSGLVISLGGASIQLGGGSGTSIRLDGGRRSDRARDSTAASGSGNSITIIAGSAPARDPPAPIGPPAPARGYATPRDPPAMYNAPRDPPSSYSPPRDPPRDPPSSYSPPRDRPRDPPSSYSPPRDPPRDPPSSYSPPRDRPRDPPSSYSPPRAPPRDPPSSYSPPRDPPRDPPSSYSAPRDPPSSYGGGRSSDQTSWRPVSSDRPLPPPSTATLPAAADSADGADTYTTYQGQTRNFPTSDTSMGRTGMRDAPRFGTPPRDPPSSMYGAPPARDPPAPAPRYGAPARDPPSPMYGAPPARDPPAPVPMYGAPARDPPRNPPAPSYGPPARDPPAPAPMYGAPARDPPRDPPAPSYGPPARDPPAPAPTYGAPARDPPRDPPAPSYGPPARDPPAPAPTYGAPARDPPRDPPAPSYGPPARDPVPAAPTVQATPVQLFQAVPVAVFNPRPRPPPRKKKHHFHKGRPRGRLVKDTIIRQVSRPAPRAPPFRGPRPVAAPQLFLAAVPQPTQTLTLASPVQNPPANPGYRAPRRPSADPPSSYGAPQRSPAAAAPPVGVVRDTLVRQVLYDRYKDDYAKLFYKGALLIGALALLPAAAVPLAVGRRRRSLFDAEPASGAELPWELRQRLGAALPELAQLDTSECLQKELCRALRAVEQSPYRDSFLLYYAVLSPDVTENSWMQQALTAARKRSCSDFYCHSLPAAPAANRTADATALLRPSAVNTTAVNATADAATAINATPDNTAANMGMGGSPTTSGPAESNKLTVKTAAGNMATTKSTGDDQNSQSPSCFRVGGFC